MLKVIEKATEKAVPRGVAVARRRREVAQLLKSGWKQVDVASALDVHTQVVVEDVAWLRANGWDIPRGSSASRAADARRQRVLALLREGLPRADILERLQISPWALSSDIKRLGDLRPPRSRIVVKDGVRRLIAAGERSPMEIARKLGCSESSVYRATSVLRSEGVSVPDGRKAAAEIRANRLRGKPLGPRPGTVERALRASRLRAAGESVAGIAAAMNVSVSLVYHLLDKVEVRP